METDRLSGVTAVFAPAFPPAFRGGGPTRSIEALAHHASLTLTPIVLTPDTDPGVRGRLPVTRNRWTQHSGVQVFYTSVANPILYLRSLLAVRKRRPQMIYLNSFFNLFMTIIPLLAWRLGFWGQPIRVVAPRGEFGAGALTRRTAKKRVYLAFFRLLRLDRGVIWHATAEHEVENIRELWGLDARIILRENDTLLPTEAEEPRRINSELRTVFLGRIVDHKGLAVALKALATCKARLSFDVYGVREDDAYFEKCVGLANDIPNNVQVQFHGAVHPTQVREVLSGYDVLVMPTAGENFGHVIAEALSASCFVLTTPYTPWSGTLRSGAGTVVADLSPQKWKEAIEHIAVMSPEQRFQLRATAGDAYTKWAARPKEPSVLETAMEMTRKSAT